MRIGDEVGRTKYDDFDVEDNTPAVPEENLYQPGDEVNDGETMVYFLGDDYRWHVKLNEAQLGAGLTLAFFFALPWDTFRRDDQHSS